MNTMGYRMKFLREAKGWTQERLACEAGIKRTNLACYELNRSRAPVKALKKIAYALDVSPVLLDPELTPEFQPKQEVDASSSLDIKNLRQIDIMLMEKVASLPESDVSKVYAYACEIDEQRKKLEVRERSSPFRRLRRAAEEHAGYQVQPSVNPDDDPEPPASEEYPQAAEDRGGYGPQKT